MLKRLSISKKLIALFLFVGIVPLTIIGLFSTVKLKEAIKDRAVKQLISIRESKKDQIENYFAMIKDQVIEHSRERTIIDAVKEFTEAFWKIERELDAEYESNKIENERGLRERYQYQKDNTYESPSDAIAKWWPEEKVSRILQHLYISTNPKKIGHKYELDYAPDGSTYSDIHKKYHPLIRNYLDRFLGQYDIFLIEPKTGYIVYSTFKELDFATSLLAGPYKNTNLAKAFRATLDSNNKDFVSLVDFESYEPYYNQTAAFIASPIYDGGNKVGVLAFQMPIDRINDIMTSHRKWRNVGLGSSVETYSVGKDFTMRNDSRFFIETPGEYFKQIELLRYPGEMINKIRVLNTTILLQKVKTLGTEDALKGNTGFGIFPDYRNIRVLSAYTPLNIEGLKWFLMSEIDEEEAFRAANMLRNTILVVVLAIAILVLIIGNVAARSISGPIKLLSRTAEEIGKGNLNKQVNIKSQDEIGVLAATFNTMTTNLKEITASRDELNKEITERKRAEEALQYERNKVINILNTMEDGVYIVNQQYDIEYVNYVLEKEFGPVEGHKCYKYFHDREEVCPWCKNPEVFQGKTVHWEWYSIKNKKTYDLIDTPLRNPDGSISKLEIFRDITKRKQAEEELKKSQAQLIQSEKMSTVGIMVAGVAHELINPMMSIVNFIEYCIKKTSTDDERFNVLEDTEREANRCIDIVDNLLTFSRMEKEGEEEFQQGDCVKIIGQVIKLLSYRFEKEQVSIIQNCDEYVPEIPMRVNRIQQVFFNIIMNALDALKDSRKKEISIDMHRQVEFMHVTIADNGPGIAPEILMKIFDPFFTTKPTGQGTGLGLSISQGIIEMHGGKISCSSKPGQGTRFDILLPVMKTEDIGQSSDEKLK